MDQNKMDENKKTESNRKFTINVYVDGLKMPMTVVGTEQEAIVRQAANNVNQQMIAVRERYKTVPNEQYYTAMVMLNSEIRALTAEKRIDRTPFIETIDDLEKEIDEVLG